MKYILSYHGLSITGSKDEIILRLTLFKSGQYHLAFYHEENEILDTISDAEKLVLEQRQDYLQYPSDVYRKRTHISFPEVRSENTNVSDSELKVENLHKMFEKLKEYIRIVKDINKTKGKNFKQNGNGNSSYANTEASNDESFFRIGAKVKVKWCSADVKGTGWKPGWYIGYVQTSDPSQDLIVVEHPIEPGSLYTLDVSPMIAEGSLKLG
jgi:hypothetical protein